MKIALTIIIANLFWTGAQAETIALNCISTIERDKIVVKEVVVSLTFDENDASVINCGKTILECESRGYRGYVSCEGGKCLEHNILAERYNLGDVNSDYIRVTAGIIPGINKSTISMRLNGLDGKRVWTTNDLPEKSETLFLDMSEGKNGYRTVCEINQLTSN